MDTKSFYTSKQVFSLISKFLAVGGQEELQTRFTKALKDLNENQCRIPVLGLQGSGKSSFLNAVLFGDILLPVDAQETTCIPTENSIWKLPPPKLRSFSWMAYVKRFPVQKRSGSICSSRA